MDPVGESPALRIACLLPSATDICVELGLAANIVGVTHECTAESLLERDNVKILTKSGLQVSSQRQIHDAVRMQNHASEFRDTDNVPSLYPILAEEWRAARPNLVLTQDLCSVCAPSSEDVRKCINDTGSNHSRSEVRIVCLQPCSLEEVADSFVQVASACNVRERGLALKNTFVSDLKSIRVVVEKNRDKKIAKPRTVVLEWLDPPFDAGHWIPNMMECAGLEQALPKVPGKSEQITWEAIKNADPDVVCVACCGFDLDRNVQDTLAASDRFVSLRAFRDKTIFACNGDSFFARPGPGLIQGVLILARCAYHDQPHVLRELDMISPPMPHSSQLVDFAQPESECTGVTDVEDVVSADFNRIHSQACEAGELSYIDPDSGYSVFTEVAHKNRGKCCGSGCRHCPFHHANVKDKLGRIQQPALMHEGKWFSLNEFSSVKVLFFSGGKDSFLALRSLVRRFQSSQQKYAIVLLTTFDADSRIVPHQAIPMDTILRQAQHLDITLLGVPIHRAGSEPYTERIRRGLAVIHDSSPRDEIVMSLVFGDLHLDHIKNWRDRELSGLCHAMEYPLWKVPYKVLRDDLESSQVPCVLTASSVDDDVLVGTLYSRELTRKLKDRGVDEFGENGEFHTVAQVWETQHEVALGLENVE